ncbi:BrnT family toxin [Maritimibacter sp. 55A14]|uniref:BrnT family toxin n=1 Tax=Maritimibacter sp. 55A14 TaxID=2174844 RepID=UPI000D60761D|nr:BrnT family toxin [Maritimibacter sp. 55A14]PWE33554.1 BrnT family toxin [Maritimibacter sp. 55A14]
MFSYDDDKREQTLRKHGIDFLDAAEVFASEHLLLPARSEIEQRQIAIGYVEGIAIAVVFTIRDDSIRIITARRARKNEREAYHTHVAQRDAENEKPN